MSAYIKPNTAIFRRLTGGFGPPVGVVVQNREADTAGLSPGDHTSGWLGLRSAGAPSASRDSRHRLVIAMYCSST